MITAQRAEQEELNECAYHHKKCYVAQKMEMKNKISLKEIDFRKQLKRLEQGKL